MADVKSDLSVARTLAQEWRARAEKYRDERDALRAEVARLEQELLLRDAALDSVARILSLPDDWSRDSMDEAVHSLRDKVTRLEQERDELQRDWERAAGELVQLQVQYGRTKKHLNDLVEKWRVEFHDIPGAISRADALERALSQPNTSTTETP